MYVFIYAPRIWQIVQSWGFPLAPLSPSAFLAQGGYLEVQSKDFKGLTPIIAVIMIATAINFAVGGLTVVRDLFKVF